MRASAALPLAFVAALCAAKATAVAEPESQPPSTWSVPAPGALMSADIDRDGNIDLIVASETAGTLHILRAATAGADARSGWISLSAGANPNDMALADFDRDGTTDAAVANHETAFVSIVASLARRANAQPVQIAVESRPHPHGVAAGDFDGDGHQDLVTESFQENALIVLWGPLLASRPPARTAVAAGRMPYQRVRAADMTGDGRPEIIATNLRSGDVSILRLVGPRRFISNGPTWPAGTAPIFVAVDDVDADGDADLLVGNSPSNSGLDGADGLTVLLNDGRGALAGRISIELGTRRGVGWIAGCRGAGKSRLIAVSHLLDDTVSLLELDAALTPRNRRTLPVGRTPKGIALLETATPGRCALFVAEHGENRLALYRP